MKRLENNKVMLDQIRVRIERRKYQEMTKDLKFNDPEDDFEMQEKQEFRFTIAFQRHCYKLGEAAIRTHWSFNYLSRFVCHFSKSGTTFLNGVRPFRSSASTPSETACASFNCLLPAL